MVLPPVELKEHVEEACLDAPVPCLFASCGCEVRPRRREQSDHQARAADAHALLAAKLSERVAALAEPTDWIVDELQATGVLTRMHDAAADEVSRNTMAGRGAIQTAIGLMAAQQASAAVQSAGCQALASLCTTTVVRDTRGMMAYMRIMGQQANATPRIVNPGAAAAAAARGWRARVASAGFASAASAKGDGTEDADGEGALSGWRCQTEQGAPPCLDDESVSPPKLGPAAGAPQLLRLVLPSLPSAAVTSSIDSAQQPRPHVQHQQTSAHLTPYPPRERREGADLVPSPGRQGRVQMTIATNT